MEETSEELPNFSVCVDLLASKQPTTSKSKTNKKEAARFLNLSEHELQHILVERHSKATKKATNWSVATFKGKHFCCYCCCIFWLLLLYMLLFYICSIRQKSRVNYRSNKTTGDAKSFGAIYATKTSQNKTTRIETKLLQKFQSRIAYKLNSTIFSF